jgi:hypothetical protein
MANLRQGFDFFLDSVNSMKQGEVAMFLDTDVDKAKKDQTDSACKYILAEHIHFVLWLSTEQAYECFYLCSNLNKRGFMILRKILFVYVQYVLAYTIHNTFTSSNPNASYCFFRFESKDEQRAKCQ